MSNLPNNPPLPNVQKIVDLHWTSKLDTVKKGINLLFAIELITLVGLTAVGKVDSLESIIATCVGGGVMLASELILGGLMDAYKKDVEERRKKAVHINENVAFEIVACKVADQSYLCFLCEDPSTKTRYYDEWRKVEEDGQWKKL